MAHQKKKVDGKFVAVPLENLIKLDHSSNICYAGLVKPARVANRAVKGFENINKYLILCVYLLKNQLFNY